MIGFDLDGTLLTEQKELGEYTVRILERAAEEGIEILPVTGRPLCGLPEEVRKIRGLRYAITANGARILDLASGTVLKEQLVDTKTAGQILDILGKYDTLREIYYDGTGYAQREQLAQIEHFFGESAMAEYVQVPGGRSDGKISYREPGGRQGAGSICRLGREKESAGGDREPDRGYGYKSVKK